MRPTSTVLRFVFTMLLTLICLPAIAQQSGDSAKPGTSEPVPTSQASDSDAKPNLSDREQKLADYLSGATFQGQFTIDGKEDANPKTEQYKISRCEKLDAPDLYRLTARIKYGDVDSEIPLDIKILWSGNTPVITLDSFWIPGMGTFGARVLIHSDRYAGTWQHDAVGGHMFGRIVKAAQE